MNKPDTDREQRIVGSRSGSKGPGPEVMAAATLTGNEVVNAKGEDLGDVVAIMLDVPSGRVAYAVLSSGGVFGLGDRLYAIPWAALRLDTDNHCFILDVERDRLRNAPGFNKERWPSMADRTWATHIHNYYQTKPYWD